jgi:hypothetical protein
MIETRYIGNCEHLDCGNIASTECLKRYYKVFDPFIGKHVVIAYCNDYLKLIFQNKHQIYDRYSMPRIEDILYEELNLPRINRYSRAGGFAPCNIIISDRPCMVRSIPFKDCCDWYLKNRSNELHRSISRAIDGFIIQNQVYKKHKTNCESIQRMFRKMHHIYEESERKILFNEILLLIFKLYYNETH